MRKILTILLAFVALLSLLPACSQAETETPAAFSVGFGQAEINPKETATLAGYGDDSQRVVSRVSESIYTTCTAIRDESGNTVLIFTADLLQAKDAVSNPVKKLNIVKQVTL